MEITKVEVKNFGIYSNYILKLIKQNYFINFPNKDFNEKYFMDKINNMFNYIKNNNAIIYIAIEETVCGLLWIFERNYITERRLHINELVVDEKFRGRGIGIKLMDKAIEYAENNNIDKIDLFVRPNNYKAIDFYKNKGFNIDCYLMCLDVHKIKS